MYEYNVGWQTNMKLLEMRLLSIMIKVKANDRFILEFLNGYQIAYDCLGPNQT